jgi:hypothetical protein
MDLEREVAENGITCNGCGQLVPAEFIISHLESESISAAIEFNSYTYYLAGMRGDDISAEAAEAQQE